MKPVLEVFAEKGDGRVSCKKHNRDYEEPVGWIRLRTIEGKRESPVGVEAEVLVNESRKHRGFPGDRSERDMGIANRTERLLLGG